MPPAPKELDMKDKTSTPKKVTPEIVKAQIDFIRRIPRPPKQLDLFKPKGEK